MTPEERKEAIYLAAEHSIGSIEVIDYHLGLFNIDPDSLTTQELYDIADVSYICVNCGWGYEVGTQYEDDECMDCYEERMEEERQEEEDEEA